TARLTHRDPSCAGAAMPPVAFPSAPFHMKTLGIGFAGARYIARFHLESFRRLPAGVAEVRGVCSRTQEGAEAFARPNNIPFATDSFDALLTRDDIDVIDIVTPPNLHHDFAIRAARAGKHVIMEK